MNFRLSIFAVLGFLLPIQAQADQLAWLSRSEAEAAKAYFLSIQKPVILACYCCDDSDETWFSYSNVEIKDTGTAMHTGSGNYYEVVLSNSNVSHAVDLAYVHVDVHGMRMCVGEILNMNCDPCTEPARVQKFRVTSASIGERDISSVLAGTGAYLEMSNRGAFWYMNNIRVNSGTNSCGAIRNIEIEEIPESDEAYAMTVANFDWEFTNSYNDSEGTCQVIWTYVFKPDETIAVVQITKEDGEIMVFQGVDDGNPAY